MTDVAVHDGWSPSDEQARATRVMQFAAQHGVATYPELVRRSQADPAWFWGAVVEDLAIPFLEPYRQVLDDGEGPAWTTWFTGGRLNLAAATVGRWAATTPDRVAVIEDDERGHVTTLTYAELWTRVRALASGLVELGVEPGDRVALSLPMSIDAVVASHACAYLGAVQVPLFSGLAPGAVAERLRDAEATVVLTLQETLRKGQVVPLRRTIDAAVADLPNVHHVVVRDPQGFLGPRETDWATVEDAGTPAPPVPVDSEHPYLLAYTSGTTGRPKGVVHATGGFLVKIAAEAAYQTDIGARDRLLWFTDLGWLMGAWSIVGSHANGASVVMCAGAPTTPVDRVWATCGRHEVTVLGLSPTLVRSLMAHGRAHVDAHDLTSLRVLASTGEPWDAASYAWYADVVGQRRLPVVNFSGGTEVGACFFSCTPAHPIRPLSVGLPSLGMAVDVVDGGGRSLPPGQPGELVCRMPWPGMTRGIWKDSERYLDAYWRHLPGVWTHGDLVEVDADGHWFVLGRSDDTLNVAGKRIGPAEIESVLTGHDDVLEAAVVGAHHPVKGTAPWAFCVTSSRDAEPSRLADELRDAVAREVGRAFLPERVVFVPALPKTRSMKTVRHVLRALANEEPPGDTTGIEDTAVLDVVRDAIVAGAT